jgi:hypothetical protein
LARWFAKKAAFATGAKALALWDGPLSLLR